MCDALSRLMSLAPTLRGIEFKVLAQLTEWALEGRTAASYNEIRDALKSDRKSTIQALRTLEERDLIAVVSGRHARCRNEFRLLFYAVPKPIERGGNIPRTQPGEGRPLGTPPRRLSHAGGRA